jgi:hypothetical protein
VEEREDMRRTFLLQEGAEGAEEDRLKTAEEN